MIVIYHTASLFNQYKMFHDAVLWPELAKELNMLVNVQDIVEGHVLYVPAIILRSTLTSGVLKADWVFRWQMRIWSVEMDPTQGTFAEVVVRIEAGQGKGPYLMTYLSCPLPEVRYKAA